MKKLSLALSAFFLLVFLARPPVAKADIYSFQQELKNCGQGNSFSLECWIAGADQLNSNGAPGVLTGLTQGLITMLIGELPSLEEINSTAPASYMPGGAVGVATNLIAELYAHPPASSVEYFADLGKNLGIIKPAYAQAGVGFEGLRPILPLWKAFRNIAYLFFTIVFIVIGFAIMFRVKLDPQTVISIQNAIPRVVVALILVTFSYAIAGLLIDLMYVILITITTALGAFGAIAPAEATAFQQQYLQADLIKTITSLLGTGWEAIKAFLTGTGVGAASIVAAIVVIIAAIIAAIATSGAAIPGILTAGGGIALMALGWAISLFAFLFRILFMLIKAYVISVFLIIISPLALIIEALPGQRVSSSWFRSLLANLLVFPVTALILILCEVILKKIGGPEPMWAPPLIGGNVAIIKAAIALGTLMIIPTIADMLQRAIGGWGVPVGAPTILVAEKETLAKAGRGVVPKGISGIWKAIRAGKTP